MARQKNGPKRPVLLIVKEHYINFILSYPVGLKYIRQTDPTTGI
ncbi:hypothetical protein P278_10430 [Zhouia amylolytica AD3]|uniref:Uncharacterized protein n=1 Tax=Zhouia amylolytica AD3 TaxID=1286632 RepID=W2UPC4_9FLAO|nr:hypothetical protein P278_10430 [Zhouia amylolytica AD3]